MSATRISDLDRQFAIGEQIRVREHDQHGIVMVETDACVAKIALQGAHVLSWQPKGQADLLWCAPLPPAGTGKAIRGGVPICWPWFGPHASDSSQPQHGLVRTVDWRLVETKLADDGAHVTFEIESYGAHLRMEVRAGAELRLALTTRNTSAAPLTITEALHTYFRVGDAGTAEVGGLDGCAYRDNTDGGREKTWRGVCRMERETIAVFETAPDVAEIIDPMLKRRIHIQRTGGRSTVAWNPVDNIAPLKDVPAGGQRQFVCVESGNVWSSAVTIASGTEHRLEVQYAIAPL